MGINSQLGKLNPIMEARQTVNLGLTGANWVNYGAPYSDAAIYMDPEGFVYLEGLIKNGIVENGAAFPFDSKYTTLGAVRLPTIANAALGHFRVDFTNNITISNGTSNAWCALGGRCWGSDKTKGWITPTLSNGWTAFTSGGIETTAAYMIDSRGFVHLRGNIMGGTVAATIFTLPVGFRPPSSRLFLVASQNSSNQAAYGRVDVYVDGQVYVVNANNTCLSLDGIYFPISNERWQPLMTQDSWRNYNNSTNEEWTSPSFNIDRYGIMHLAGMCSSGSLTQGLAHIGGYTNHGLIELIGVNSNGSVGRLDISKSSLVKISSPANNTWVSLDGIAIRMKVGASASGRTYGGINGY